MPTLNEQCDPRHPLRKLGERIPWRDFEEAFGEYYSEEGRPAKPVRLMVGLLHPVPQLMRKNGLKVGSYVGKRSETAMDTR